MTILSCLAALLGAGRNGAQQEGRKMGMIGRLGIGLSRGAPRFAALRRGRTLGWCLRAVMAAVAMARLTIATDLAAAAAGRFS